MLLRLHLLGVPHCSGHPLLLLQSLTCATAPRQAEAEEDQELIEDEGRSRKRTARGSPKSGSEQEKTAREQLKQASQREVRAPPLRPPSAIASRIEEEELEEHEEHASAVHPGSSI